MGSYAIGADGALYMDEKVNIHALNRPDRVTKHLLEKTSFAIGDGKGKVRLLADFSEIKCRQAFLGASYKLSDKAFPAKINLWAVTPFGFEQDAHLPAAAFLLKIKNDSKKKRTYTFGFAAENVSKDNFHQIIRTEHGCGVQLGSASMLSVQAGYMTQCFLTDGDAQCVRYLQRENQTEAFLDAVKKGIVADLDYTMPGDGDCAAMLQTFTLEAGESKLVRLVYAWYAPNMQFGQENGSDLLFKNAYAQRFSDSANVADYVLKHWKRLFGFSRAVTDAVRACADSKTFEQTAFDNFRSVCTAMPYRLDEIGNAKVFYKNSFGAPTVFAKADFETLFPATVYFDFEGEVDEVCWIFEYGISEQGQCLGIQSVTEERQFFENTAPESMHMSLIWRVYRLYLLSGDVSYIERFWDKLKQIAGYINVSGWVQNGECVFTSETSDVSLMTNYYILSLLCMEKMSALLGEAALSAEYAKLASYGKAYVKRNLFNGRFYMNKYPAAEAEEMCSAYQILPMFIGHALGLCIADVGQYMIAIENIYLLNFSESALGVKASAGDAAADAATEVMYAQALLQAGKNYLASLVCKAQYMREPAPHKTTADTLFIHALCPDAFDIENKHLHIGKTGTVCFLKDSVLIAEADKTLTVKVFGAPMCIHSVSYVAKAFPERIVCGDMELMYARDENKLTLNAPLILCEGMELKIYLTK